MPLILNIETSTDICSICISKDGDVLSIQETERSFSHSEVIAPFIEACIKESGYGMSDLDAVAVSMGPGSYTALRIGTATAKGVCFALDLPLIAVGTLDALYNGVKKEVKGNDLVIPMIDARRKEVYRGIYSSTGEIIKAVEPTILDEHTFHEYKDYDQLIFCGDGVAKARDILKVKNSIFLEVECSSKFMVELSEEKFANKQFEDLSYYEPYYYKGPNITVQKKNILR